MMALSYDVSTINIVLVLLLDYYQIRPLVDTVHYKGFYLLIIIIIIILDKMPSNHLNMALSGASVVMVMITVLTVVGVVVIATPRYRYVTVT